MLTVFVLVILGGMLFFAAIAAYVLGIAWWATRGMRAQEQATRKAEEKRFLENL